MNIRKLWKKLAGGITLLTALSFLLLWCSPALAATTADVTVTATPSYISITATNTTYDFGAVVESSYTNTTTAYFPIVNSCSVISDNTISAVTGNWTGGTEWIHDDTATPGIVTAGLTSNQEGAWGTGDVIVQNAVPQLIADDQAATTNWSFGLNLLAPTAYHDGAQKTMVVRISAVAS